MGTAYTRQSSFSDGDTITAALFNDEYNQLLTAFSYASSSTTGHQHDGTAGEGGNVHTIGDQDLLNKIVADSTNNRWGVFVQVSSSAVEQIRISDGVISPVTDNDIDLGTSSLEFKDAYFDGTITTDGLTVSSTTNLDGAIQVDNTITVGVDDTGYDVKFFGDTASAYMLWDTSTDDLVLAGAAGIDLAGDIDVDGTANLDIVDIDGAVDMASTLTLAGNADFNGDLDVDGTTNLDAVDIDGAVQIDAAVTVGVNDTGYDVKFFGDTASAYMLWDTSADDLVLAGAAGIDLAGDIDVDGTANLDAVDIDGAVQIDGTVTVGVDDTGKDVKFFGATSGSYLLWDESADSLLLTDSTPVKIGDSQDMTLYHDGSNSYLTNAVGALKVATETSGIAITIGHTTSETTVADNLTVTGDASIGGNFDVTGTIDFSDSAITNVGSIQLDSIAGDADSNTSITFSGSDVITVAAAGTNQITFNDGSILPVTDNDIDLGSSSYEFKDGYFDGTLYADAINFNGTAIASTAAELNIVDGDTSATSTTLAAADRVVVNDNGTMVQVALSDFETFFESAIDTFSTIDINGGTIDGATVGANSASSGAFTTITASGTFVGSSTVQGTTITATTAFVPDASDGAALGTSALEFSDLFLADGAVINFGDDQDVTLTHVADTGLLLNSTMAIQFNDSSQYINAPSATVLDINATDEIELNATLADVNANLDVSGTYTGGGLMTTGGNIVIPDAGNIGAASDTDAIAISSGGVVTMNQIPVFSAGINVSGGTIAGTLATAAQGNVTSLGTLTALTVDDVAVDGKVVTMTGSSSDTAVFTAGTNGTLSIVTTDAAAAAANITITADGTFEVDGTTITLDSAGDIVLDADGADVIFKDGGTAIGTFTNSSSDFVITSNVQDKDIIFKGDDGGGAITALTFDMSEAGAATFNDKIVATELDISGDIDIDGTSNLDAVDVDGAVNFAADVTYADGADIITASAGTSNFRAGVNAGNSIASGGNYNVCVGDEAGTALTTGDNNVAVGYNALLTEDADSLNTAVGANALKTLNVGASGFNTAVGYLAGEDTTTGIQDTFIGANAGRNITDADYNTAVGAYSLATDTLGSQSTAVGRYALFTQNFTSATNSHNTAVGHQTAWKVTTGVQNTILGSMCHDNLTTGDLNVAVGYNNGPSAVDVDSEIVIGNSVTGAGTNTVRIGTAGGTATLGLDGSDTSWAAASDSRLKKDVAGSTVGLEFINALRPITFKWNAKNAIADSLPQYDADSSEPVHGVGKSHHGFIAQEVKTVIDANSDVADGHNIWSEDPDGTQQIAFGNMVPMLVKAIQEQTTLIEELTARIATLEG